MRGLAIAALGIAAAGCSVFMTRPPSPSCTASRVQPIIDTAITAAFVAGAVKVGSERDCGPDGCHTFDTTPLYLLGALPFAVAAVYGFSTAASCRAAQRKAAAVPRIATEAAATPLVDVAVLPHPLR